jgi:hypothetical protein
MFFQHPPKPNHHVKGRPHNVRNLHRPASTSAVTLVALRTSPGTENGRINPVIILRKQGSTASQRVTPCVLPNCPPWDHVRFRRHRIWLIWSSDSLARRADPARCARPDGRARAGRPGGRGRWKPAPQASRIILVAPARSRPLRAACGGLRPALTSPPRRDQRPGRGSPRRVGTYGVT